MGVSKKRLLGKRRSLIAVAGFALIAYAALLVWPMEPEKHRIAPVTREDGSVVHWLVNGGDDGVRGNQDDQKWVLTFPPNLFVRSLEQDFHGNIKRNLGEKFQFNRNISLTVLMPDMAFVPDPYDQDRKELLRISWDSVKVPYGPGSYTIKEGLSFSAQHEMRTSLRCRKNHEVVPGLFELREPTEAEMASMRDKFGPGAAHLGSKAPGYDAGCGLSGISMTRYALYGPDGGPAGFGECPTEGKYEGYRHCSFWFWLPLERLVNVSYAPKYLPRTDEIRNFVVELLMASTDFEQSVNLPVKGY